MKTSKSLKEVWSWKEKASKDKSLKEIYEELIKSEAKRRQAISGAKTNKDRQHARYYC